MTFFTVSLSVLSMLTATSAMPTAIMGLTARTPKKPPGRPLVLSPTPESVHRRHRDRPRHRGLHLSARRNALTYPPTEAPCRHRTRHAQRSPPYFVNEIPQVQVPAHGHDESVRFGPGQAAQLLHCKPRCFILGEHQQEAKNVLVTSPRQGHREGTRENLFQSMTVRRD